MLIYCISIDIIVKLIINIFIFLGGEILYHCNYYKNIHACLCVWGYTYVRALVSNINPPISSDRP